MQVGKKPAVVAPLVPTAPAPAPAPSHGFSVLGAGKSLLSKLLVGPVHDAPVDASKIASVLPRDLSALATDGANGALLRLGGGFVDGMRVRVHRWTVDGQPETRIHFKVAGPARRRFYARLEKLGAQPHRYSFDEGRPGPDGRMVQGQGKFSLDWTTLGVPFFWKAPVTSLVDDVSRKLSGDGWSLEFIPNNGPKAIRGQVRIRIQGDDAAVRERLDALLASTGLQHALAPATPTALKRYALMRLLWHVDPDAAQSLAGGGLSATRAVSEALGATVKNTGLAVRGDLLGLVEENDPRRLGEKLRAGDLDELKISKIEKALKKAGISQERMDGLRYEEVSPGHFTVIDDVAAREMKDAGVRFAYSTVAAAEDVLKILQNGQRSTVSRWEEGMLTSGMSSSQDVGSGGAEGVFSRLITDKAEGRDWTGRAYKIILDPSLLGRLDVFGWPADRFGKSWGLGPANFGPALVKDIESHKRGFADFNEIVAPYGNGPQYIRAVVATNEWSRERLIEVLKEAGFAPPGGQSVEEFVRLSHTVDSKLLG